MTWQLLLGDCRKVIPTLPERSIHCCVTSPPYFGLRDYGAEDQIGLEQTPDAFVAELVAVFRDVRRVLRDDGTLWLNLGDSYAGSGAGHTGSVQGAQHGDVGSRAQWKSDAYKRHNPPAGLKQKDLIGIPWRVAFALQADGWYLRQDIIWHKPNPMPESVRDRCTKAHEYIFLLSKGPRYYFDSEAIKEPAVEGQRNRRSVWTVATRPFKGAHFATFPPDLIRPCILAGCPTGGTVLDPFSGAGTTGLVSIQHGRCYTGVELNPEYIALAERRFMTVQPLISFDAVTAA
jgi:DNA modification methylase